MSYYYIHENISVNLNILHYSLLKNSPVKDAHMFYNTISYLPAVYLLCFLSCCLIFYVPYYLKRHMLSSLLLFLLGIFFLLSCFISLSCYTIYGRKGIGVMFPSPNHPLSWSLVLSVGMAPPAGKRCVGCETLTH